MMLTKLSKTILALSLVFSLSSEAMSSSKRREVGNEEAVEEYESTKRRRGVSVHKSNRVAVGAGSRTGVDSRDIVYKYQFMSPKHLKALRALNTMKDITDHRVRSQATSSSSSSSSSSSFHIEESKEEKRDDVSLSVSPSSSIETEYPDIIPKIKHAFTLYMSSTMKWNFFGDDDDYCNSRVFEIYNTIKKILTGVNFVPLVDACTGITEGETGDEKLYTICGVFGKYKTGKLIDSIIINMQYYPDSPGTIFKTTKLLIDERMNKPIAQKWNLNDEDGSKNEFDFTCMCLSWRWVDAAIHSINRNIGEYSAILDKERSKFTKHLYDNINKHGLQNSIIRILLIVNSKSHYAFSTVYDTEKEKKNGLKFLLKLKKEIEKT